MSTGHDRHRGCLAEAATSVGSTFPRERERARHHDNKPATTIGLSVVALVTKSCLLLGQGGLRLSAIAARWPTIALRS